MYVRSWALAHCKALAECRADKTWQTFEAPNSGHDVMVDAPEWLADVLLKVA